jgi:5'/3'-nucleotidase
VPRGTPNGARFARQSQKISQTLVREQQDPRGRKYFWLDESVALEQVEADSDYAAVLAGEISITPLQVDRTDYKSLNHLSNWLESLRSDK